ncbi:MAG: ubiquinone/menaquinone biosynthesis methyltransferase [Acidobacteriota bacterium]
MARTLRTAFESPEAKRQYVRRLFATIADRYDLITVVLSYGRDRAWKQRLIREAALIPGRRVLDLACGTGDLALAAARRGATVTGLDVTHRMLELARAKASQAAGSGRAPRFVTGDMMALPFPSASFDRVTTGYGLRNVPDLDGALAEIARVLAPGGMLLSLDFNRPASAAVRGAYLGYLTVVGSLLGWLLHGDADTYRYIPASIQRYPGADGVARRLEDSGFRDVRIAGLLGGLMSLHVATRRR